MTTPNLEKIIEDAATDYCRATGFTPLTHGMRAGLTAVIEKHIGPLMFKAACRAMACARPEDYQGEMPEEQAVEAMKREHDVAASIVQGIIEQMKEQP